jgi:processive 1,2-diacylglycerol beta-glucosyltransferase
MGKRKIFILYARFGEGHWQAASALEQSFAALGNAEVVLIDLLAESHPVINEVSRFVYRRSYQVMPQVYGWVYEATKSMKSDSLFASWLHSFGTHTLRKLIEQERPDAIIHTFPTIVLPAISERMGRRIPMFNVVTDFDLHQRWIHPEVDKYYVATEDLSKQLQALGVAETQVAATGIPIRRAFEAASRTNVAAAEIAPRFGLNAAHGPVVLVMASSGGTASDTAELCLSLTKLAQVQVVVVCGRNSALKRSLREQLLPYANVSVLGFVERMDELMTLSACIVTKPGGLTLSEALATRLPIFIHRPVPGQERNNARYLESKGAAVLTRTARQLVAAIEELLFEPGRRANMLLAIDKIRREGAADRVAFDIASQLNIMEEASVSLML